MSFMYGVRHVSGYNHQAKRYSSNPTPHPNKERKQENYLDAFQARKLFECKIFVGLHHRITCKISLAHIIGLHVVVNSFSPMFFSLMWRALIRLHCQDLVLHRFSTLGGEISLHASPSF